MRGEARDQADHDLAGQSVQPRLTRWIKDHRSGLFDADEPSQ